MTLIGLTIEEKQARWATMRRQWRESHPDKVKEYHLKHAIRPETRERKLQWARDHKDQINARRRAAWLTHTAQSTIGENADSITEMTQEAL
jgi:hypothetical protein